MLDDQDRKRWLSWLENTYVAEIDGLWSVRSATHYGRLSPLYSTREEAEAHRLSNGGSIPLLDAAPVETLEELSS